MATVSKKQVATIAIGTALASGVLIGDKVLCAILMPAGWDAAGLSFQASDDDGVTWNDMYDDAGLEVKLSPATPAAKRLSLDPSLFAGVTWIKVRSGLTGAPVNQTAARALTLVSRKFYALS